MQDKPIEDMTLEERKAGAVEEMANRLSEGRVTEDEFHDIVWTWCLEDEMVWESDDDPPDWEAISSAITDRFGSI